MIEATPTAKCAQHQPSTKGPLPNNIKGANTPFSGPSTTHDGVAQPPHDKNAILDANKEHATHAPNSTLSDRP